MDIDSKDWKKHFQIESTVDLDFVIGQQRGFAAGMESSSPAEFKRRILAAKISYDLRLKSIDYTLRRYVDENLYEREELPLGGIVSGFLRNSTVILMEELKKLHSQGDELPFGVIGAELTLFKLPNTLDTARMLANRGLLLEVLPLLRVCLEMIAWAHTAFYITKDDVVIALKAQNCISSLKRSYGSAGRIYGYLSRFAHWDFLAHREFIQVHDDGVSVLRASVRYRAMSLALCLVVLDVFIEAIRVLYGEKSEGLVKSIQEATCPDPARKSYFYVSQIADMCDLNEIREIQSLIL